MKKKIASFILAAAMVMSLPMAASAAELTTGTPEPIGTAIEDGGISVMSISTTTVNTDRLSTTSGNITAYAAFSNTASTSVCTIYLQEKYNGSWRTATGLGTTSYTKTAYNTKSISAGKTFTLISGKTYRAKVVFNATINGTSYTRTHYSGSF